MTPRFRSVTQNYFSVGNITCPPKWQLLLCGWHLVVGPTPDRVRNMKSLLLCLPSLPLWLLWLDLRFKWPRKLIRFSVCESATLQITPLTRCSNWWTPQMNSPTRPTVVAEGSWSVAALEWKKKSSWIFLRGFLFLLLAVSCSSSITKIAVASWFHRISKGKPIGHGVHHNFNRQPQIYIFFAKMEERDLRVSAASRFFWRNLSAC